MKIILFLILAVFNIYVWANLLDFSFYELVIAVITFVSGLYFYGEIRFGKWKK